MAKTTNEDLLAKINELVLTESRNNQDIKNNIAETKVVKDSVAALAIRVEEYYVNQDQFWPIKTAVYGLMGGILLTVLIAVLALVVVPRVASPNGQTPAPMHSLSIAPSPSVLPVE